MFKTYKFHASSLGKLMVNPRKKSETLSETTKSFLREVYIKEKYGRDRSYQTISKYTQKGTMVESDSLELVGQVSEKTLFKNLKTLENDFVIGTPDVILDDLIIDIKSSWDLWTFAEVTREKAVADYGWQIFAYLWMAGKTQGRLAYALVNTPEMLITDEIYRLSFKMSEKEAEQARINFEFSDIAPTERVKFFDIEFDAGAVEQVKTRITACREYLGTMTL